MKVIWNTAFGLNSNFSGITIMFLVYLDVIVLFGGYCFVSQTMKMKSSHDVLHDPKLSSQPVVETTAAGAKVHNLFLCHQCTKQIIEYSSK